MQMAHFSGFLADKKFEFTLNLFVAEIVSIKGLVYKEK